MTNVMIQVVMRYTIPISKAPFYFKALQRIQEIVQHLFCCLTASSISFQLWNIPSASICDARRLN